MKVGDKVILLESDRKNELIKFFQTNELYWDETAIVKKIFCSSGDIDFIQLDFGVSYDDYYNIWHFYENCIQKYEETLFKGVDKELWVI